MSKRLPQILGSCAESINSLSVLVEWTQGVASSPVWNSTARFLASSKQTEWKLIPWIQHIYYSPCHSTACERLPLYASISSCVKLVGPSKAWPLTMTLRLSAKCFLIRSSLLYEGSGGFGKSTTMYCVLLENPAWTCFDPSGDAAILCMKRASYPHYSIICSKKYMNHEKVTKLSFSAHVMNGRAVTRPEDHSVVFTSDGNAVPR